MKFGKLSFDFQAVGWDLRRFWPAAVLFGLFMLLQVSGIAPDEADDLWKYNPMCFFLPLYGVLCACLLFSDLFTARYAIAVHALPLTRGTWFRHRCLSGLALFLLPFVATGTVALALTQFALRDVLLWAFQMVTIWLYGFCVGVLACNLSGTGFGAVVASAILAFGIPLTESAISLVCHHLLAGICEHSAVTTFLSPILYTLQFSGDQVSWFYYGAVMVASTLVLLLAAVLHRKRNLESAGDFVAFPWLKGWIKAITAILGGLSLGIILMSIMGWDWEVPQGRLLLVLRWLLPGILIGRILAEMIVEKTVRVLHKKQLLQYLLCVAVAAGLTTLVWLDLPGAQTRIPEVDEVASVEIIEDYSFDSDLWFSEGDILLTSPDSIAAATELHEAITGHLDCCTTDYGSSRKVIFYYTLKNGSTLTRQYMLAYPLYPIPHPVDAALADFFGNQDISAYFLFGEDCGPEKGKEYITRFNILDHQNDTWYYLNPEQVDGLLELIMEDIEADRALIDPNGSKDTVLYSINIKTKLPTVTTKSNSNSGWVYIFTEDSLAAQWLKENLPRFEGYPKYS